MSLAQAIALTSRTQQTMTARTMKTSMGDVTSMSRDGEPGHSSRRRGSARLSDRL